MTLAEMDQILKGFESKLTPEQRELLQNEMTVLRPVFPFSEWEYRFAFLLEHKAMNFAEYEELRSRYVAGNQYLHLFGLAPRIFGEIWGQEHIAEIDERFAVASKKLDKNFDGEYDLRLGSIKVEVKAARAIHTKLRGDLVSKALRYDSGDPFWMNFQQLKPDMCDVFIFIGVWVDKIVYWVLSSKEAKANPYISSQHRGGIEFQIGVKHNNLRDFEKYAVGREQLASAVAAKAGVTLKPLSSA
jgi:hypothetical protein